MRLYSYCALVYWCYGVCFVLVTFLIARHSTWHPQPKKGEIGLSYVLWNWAPGQLVSRQKYHGRRAQWSEMLRVWHEKQSGNRGKEAGTVPQAIPLWNIHTPEMCSISLHGGYQSQSERHSSITAPLHPCQLDTQQFSLHCLCLQIKHNSKARILPNTSTVHTTGKLMVPSQSLNMYTIFWKHKSRFIIGLKANP